MPEDIGEIGNGAEPEPVEVVKDIDTIEKAREEISKSNTISAEKKAKIAEKLSGISRVEKVSKVVAQEIAIPVPGPFGLNAQKMVALVDGEVGIQSNTPNLEIRRV